METEIATAPALHLIDSYLALIPLLPLCGSVCLSSFVAKDQKVQAISGWIATLFAACAFGIALHFFTLALDNPSGEVTFKLWDWFRVGELHAEFGLRMDRLAGVMTLIVTGVGSLIHLYAVGYMEHDDARARFFLYLNLFLFSMLCLVLGDNLLVMFVGWEGVGLCSYLLIGFWYKEMPNAIAGQKAFVVNRIGDAGFLLGIFTLFVGCHTFNFQDLQTAVPQLDPTTIALAAGLLFVGAVGKSAQFPLYIWLPDAMAGPTPVSALIHAATMVTAGVYMVTRMSFLYILAPQVLVGIAIVGTGTAILAATIALAQNDIKKVLAYSTVSQLGFMFMALGAGAFSNGIFHVVTHAFFKACLFMGAGSVIMGCHHEQDMRHFGGLRSKMPITFWTYLIATFAIAGFPFLSGFYSKDAILWTVYSSEVLTQVHVFGDLPLSHCLWAIGAGTALLTAFYMTRSLVLTFFGEYRGHAHPHESPWVVTVPLIILAGLSFAFGFVDDGKLVHFLGVWTRPDMLQAHEVIAENPEFEHLEHLSMFIAVLGMGLAFFLYMVKPTVITWFSKTFVFLHRALLNKWWIDELFGVLILNPIALLARLLFSIVDRAIIDSAVNGAGEFVDTSREIVKQAHTGRIGFYAVTMFAFSVFFIVFWLVL